MAALAIPEEYGGAGASLRETHVVLEELGATLTPAPLLGSAVLCAQLVLELGDQPACERLLPRIAAGEIAALAWTGPGRMLGRRTLSTADGDRLTGTASFVLDGDIADLVLVVARDARGPRRLRGGRVRAQCVRTRRRWISPAGSPPSRSTAPVAPGSGRRPAAALAAALERTVVALTAEQVGGAARIFERTVAYTKDRVQFGRPIGSFQALKHRMADLHVLVEAARSASYAAVEGAVSAAAAKVYCSEAFCRVAGEGIQLHGGIAITWEHDAQLYFKRAHGSAQLFGSPAAHLRRVEAAVGL